MFKTTSKVIMTAAAAGLAFAPIAAQANTRAADAAPVYSNTAAQPGVGRAAEGENAVGATGIIVALFAGAAIIGGIIIAADEDGDDGTQSPGV